MVEIILSGIVTFLIALDVFFTVIRTFRRRRIGDPSGIASLETRSQYWRRVALSIAPHVVVCGILIGGFWAIVHFGPLRPVHEWFT
jgi:hypothetical protein